jgi:ABC-type antimicrobial peptide transport system permease subunit
MFALFGGLALLVSAIGLYGAIAFSVAQRTREFGIRLAVGAGKGRLMRAVLFEGIRSAGIGLFVGTLGGLVAAGKIGPLLFHVSPRDPFVFGSAALVLLATAVAASVLPAWRAARTDPLVALRSQ